MEHKIKERPILFNAEMVCAILEGKKTQTRRALKNQENYLTWNCATRVSESDYLREFLPGAVESTFVLQENSGELVDSKWQPVSCPLGKIGDQLWVREAIQATQDGMRFGVKYLADEKTQWLGRDYDEKWLSMYDYRGAAGATIPSIHMRRWASRIQLEITNVRLESLRSITEQDAMAEGVTQEQITPLVKRTAYSEFKNLWCSTYGGDNWDWDPWVWVIEFKRLTP